jgi:hypothetical protein
MKYIPPIAFTASSTEFVELSDIERFDDGSGYCAQIRIGSGEYACLGRLFYFDDLKKFLGDLKEIYRVIGGVAELRTRYEKEYLRFDMGPSGHLNITGMLMDYGGLERVFQFGFVADQSYLPPFLKGIEEAIKVLEP